MAQRQPVQCQTAVQVVRIALVSIGVAGAICLNKAVNDPHRDLFDAVRPYIVEHEVMYLDVGSFAEAKPSVPLWNPLEVRNLQVKGVTSQQVKELVSPGLPVGGRWSVPKNEGDLTYENANGDSLTIYQNPAHPTPNSGQVAGGCQIVYIHRMSSKDVALARIKAGRHDPFRRY